MKPIAYTITIRFANGIKKIKKHTVEKEILPFLVMRLKSQYRMADIDWEGSDGSYGTTEIKK